MGNTHHLINLVKWIAILHFTSTVFSVDTPPEHTVARVGESVTLTCRDSSIYDVEWTVRLLDENTPTKIYRSNLVDNGGLLNPDHVGKYSVDTEGYDLTIYDLQLRDGGIYGCANDADVKAEVADLVILETPRITLPDIIEEENAILMCTVEYGAPSKDDIVEGVIPQISGWLDGEERIGTTSDVRGSGQYYILRYETNYTASSIDNDKEVICRVHTVDPPFVNETSDLLNILFTVRDIEYMPNNPDYYVGETMNCTAKGNPEPEIKWTAISSSGPGNVFGPTLEFKENMVGPNQWKCSATNTVKQIEMIEIDTHNFEIIAATDAPVIDPPNNDPEAWVIAVATVIPLVIVIAVVVGGVLFWNMKKKREANSGNNSKRTYDNRLSTVHEVPEPDDTVDKFDLSQTSTNLSDYYSTPSNNKPVPTGVPVYPFQPGTGRMTPPVQAPTSYPGRDSPGYADLGIRHFGGSMEGINPAVSNNPYPNGDLQAAKSRQERRRESTNNNEPIYMEANYRPLPPQCSHPADTVIYSQPQVPQKKPGQKPKVKRQHVPTAYAQVNFDNTPHIPSDSD